MPNYCPNCGESLGSSTTSRSVPSTLPKPAARKARKPSASNRKYSRAFKRVAPTYKKKNGQWKKDGFKRAVRAAHRMAKRLK